MTLEDIEDLNKVFRLARIAVDGDRPKLIKLLTLEDKVLPILKESIKTETVPVEEIKQP